MQITKVLCGTFWSIKKTLHPPTKVLRKDPCKVNSKGSQSELIICHHNIKDLKQQKAGAIKLFIILFSCVLFTGKKRRRIHIHKKSIKN